MRKNAIHLLTVCFKEATKMRSSYFNGEVFSAEEGPAVAALPRVVTFFHDIDSFFMLIHSDEKKQTRIRDSGGFSG